MSSPFVSKNFFKGSIPAAAPTLRKRLWPGLYFGKEHPR